MQELICTQLSNRSTYRLIKNCFQIWLHASRNRQYQRQIALQPAVVQLRKKLIFRNWKRLSSQAKYTRSLKLRADMHRAAYVLHAFRAKCTECKKKRLQKQTERIERYFSDKKKRRLAAVFWE